MWKNKIDINRYNNFDLFSGIRHKAFYKQTALEEALTRSYVGKMRFKKRIRSTQHCPNTFGIIIALTEKPSGKQISFLTWNHHRWIRAGLVRVVLVVLLLYSIGSTRTGLVTELMPNYVFHFISLHWVSVVSLVSQPSAFLILETKNLWDING